MRFVELARCHDLPHEFFVSPCKDEAAKELPLVLRLFPGVVEGLEMSSTSPGKSVCKVLKQSSLASQDCDVPLRVWFYVAMVRSPVGDL